MLKESLGFSQDLRNFKINLNYIILIFPEVKKNSFIFSIYFVMVANLGSQILLYLCPYILALYVLDETPFFIFV